MIYDWKDQVFAFEWLLQTEQYIWRTTPSFALKANSLKKIYGRRDQFCFEMPPTYCIGYGPRTPGFAFTWLLPWLEEDIWLKGQSVTFKWLLQIEQNIGLGKQRLATKWLLQTYQIYGCSDHVLLSNDCYRLNKIYELRDQVLRPYCCYRLNKIYD